ncbi:MAG: ComF family protein [Clostridia bacterium]|nr:ComF family protein [Clostridia bacterium]
MKNNLKKILLNLVYPPRCVFCSRRLSPKTRLLVCPTCANELPYCRAYSRCRRCGKPVPQGAGNMCNSCYTRKHYNTRITSAFVYTDRARDAVLAFKKEYNASGAGTLAIYVAGMVKYDFGGVDFDAVVSVPPRKKSSSEERFDQAACLGKAVARRLGIPYISHAMVQTGIGRKQSSLSYSARIENVKNKFAVKKPNAIDKKTILLIDDVCTSGATLEECAKMLKESGAFRVYAATIATVPAI